MADPWKKYEGSQKKPWDSYAGAKGAQNALTRLEKLEADGSIRPAEAQELERLRAASGQIENEVGRTGATYRGALQGGTFQLADEVYGLLGGDKEAARRKNRDAEATYPTEYNSGKTAGAIGSGVATAAATGPLGAGKTLLGTMGRGALIGGTEGSLWGLGGGEGAKDKLHQAGKFGGIGSVFGAGAPLAIAGGAAIGRGVGNMAGGAVNVGNKGRADRAILSALRKAGVTADSAADDVARAAVQGQPQYRLMDTLGVAGQRKASGIARSGDEGAEEIATYLRQRQLDQGDRVAEFTKEAFGFTGAPSGTTAIVDPRSPAPQTSAQVLSAPQTSAASTRKALEDARSATADRAYTAAREGAGAADTRGAVSAIDARVGPMQGVDIAGDGIDAKLVQFRNRLAAKSTPEGVDSIELSDFDRVLGVKQDVQDARGVALRAGRNNEARELKKLEQQLDAALEDASSGYRAANDGFREASGVIEAIDQGADMTRPGSRSVDNVARFSSMTDDEKAAARIGYGDKALARIEANKAPTSNKARDFGSTKARQEADAIANNPGLFSERMARETQMWETQNRALGGSRTADNLQDIADTGLMADAGRAVRDVSSGNFGTAVSNALAPISRAASGENAATRKLIAQVLMSTNPRAALAGAVARDASSQGRRRIAESILRALGRQPDY